MVRIRHYLDSRPQDIVLTKSGKNMSVRRLNKLKFIVGCATAALFVSLLFPIGIAAKNSLDSPGDQGTILIIASYNPDTRRMSSFISDFEHKIANENYAYWACLQKKDYPEALKKWPGWPHGCTRGVRQGSRPAPPERRLLQAAAAFWLWCGPHTAPPGTATRTEPAE